MIIRDALRWAALSSCFEDIFRILGVIGLIVAHLGGDQYIYAPRPEAGHMQGLALFLLLAFRTNSSYDRWWEGRKLWEAINNKVQDMSRMALGKATLADG